MAIPRQPSSEQLEPDLIRTHYLSNKEACDVPYGDAKTMCGLYVSYDREEALNPYKRLKWVRHMDGHEATCPFCFGEEQKHRYGDHKDRAR